MIKNVWNVLKTDGMFFIPWDRCLFPTNHPEYKVGYDNPNIKQKCKSEDNLYNFLIKHYFDYVRYETNDVFGSEKGYLVLSPKS